MQHSAVLLRGPFQPSDRIRPKAGARGLDCHQRMRMVYWLGMVAFCVASRAISALVVSDTNIPPSEMAALYDLYNSTGGSYWRWSEDLGVPWNFTNPSANPCADHWQGVNCTYNNNTALNQVTELVLSRMDLVFCLPDTLDQLTALYHLDLTVNRIQCPFPEVLTNLTNMEVLILASNLINGTIPASIGRLHKLVYLDLDTNILSGTLPSEIRNCTQLGSIILYSNLLSGPLPDSIGSLSELYQLRLEQNKLSQEIPASIGDLHNLLDLRLKQNEFRGRIPESFAALTQLEVFEVGSNYLSGTIPLFLGNFTELVGLGLYVNQFTGTVPMNLQQLQLLTYFECSYNYLTGTIPEYLGSLSLLGYLFMYSNMLTGSIPAALAQLTNLADLVLYDNYLHGSIPQSFKQLSKLRVIELSNNELTGAIEDVFHPVQQPHLQTVLLNNNQLTGTLPSALFASQSLLVFAAVSNCFHGTLPSNLCGNINLVTLVLDGLSSAQSCRHTLFPAISNSYTNHHTVSGSIPPCLFMLPNLSTLHLSGNGFSGKLPSELTISPALYDLTLSHNFLEGHIPVAVQSRKWYKLDLSYNRFDGALFTNFGTVNFNFSIYRFVRKFGLDFEEQYPQLIGDPYIIGNFTYFIQKNIVPDITLENNRLSGHIPHTIQTLEKVSVLGTNLFQCRLDRSGLPAHDSDIHNYQCGSSAFDIPYYIWLGVCIICALCMLCVVYKREYVMKNTVVAELVVSCTKWSEFANITLTQHTALHQFTHLMSWFNYTTAEYLAYILLVLSPLYCLLSHYFGIMRYEYAWSISGAFMSGRTPAVVFFITWTVLIVLVLWYVRRASTMWVSALPVVVTEDHVSVTTHTKVLIYVTYAAINLFVVVGVNSLYVYVTIYQSSGIVLLAQILLSFFKLGWNNFCASKLLHYTVAHLTTTSAARTKEVVADFFSLQVLMALINNIVVPCAVVLLISPNCFYYVFVQAPTVTATYVFGQCTAINADDSCGGYSPTEDSTSYNPPFTYSYQCSSSLVTYYSPAFLIMCIVSTFLVPLGQSTVMWLYQRNSDHSTVFMRLVSAVSPAIIRHLDSPTTSVFSLSVVLTGLLTYVGLLLTFGVVFPPLAVALAVAVWATAYFAKLKVGRYVYCAVEQQLAHLVQVIEHDCLAVGSVEVLVVNSMWMIVTISCWFYALFLFDTIGDAEGLHSAVWVLVVMPLMPAVLWVIMRCVDEARDVKKNTDNVNKLGDVSANSDVEMVDSVTSNPIIA